MNPSIEDIENESAAIEKLENKRERAQMMGELLDNENFIALFEERFIKDYALSQMANLADYSEATRKIVMERMVARSVFRNFIDDTIQQGMIAVDQLRQITLEEKHNEQDNLGE